MSWRLGHPDADLEEGSFLILEETVNTPVVVGLAEGDDGWTLTFSVGIAASRSLPEVEDFIARCRQFLLDEPVLPS